MVNDKPNQPDNSKPGDHGKPPTDPNEFGKWLVDRATAKDEEKPIQDESNHPKSTASDQP